jgi:hypothetical protein
VSAKFCALPEFANPQTPSADFPIEDKTEASVRDSSLKIPAPTGIEDPVTAVSAAQNPTLPLGTVLFMLDKALPDQPVRCRQDRVHGAGGRLSTLFKHSDDPREQLGVIVFSYLCFLF